MADPGRLIVLGSGTAVPRPDRGTSCYLVDDGVGGALLVDLGPGALDRAARAGYDLDRLDTILLTHVHPDHCADLVALLFALRNPLPRSGAPPLRLLGHPAVGELIERLRAAWPRWLEVGSERLEFVPLAPGPLPLLGALSGAAFRIEHHVSSLGYRLVLPNGFVLAFSGDATEGGELQALGSGADLFVLEAAMPDEHPTQGHLTPRRAGRVAAACAPRHLLLTHFYPPVEKTPVLERVRETFEGRVTLAQDGAVFSLEP